jgi:hypothetical protein
MKAYFQKFKEGHPANINFCTAYEGFFQMGFEMLFVDNGKQIPLQAGDYVAVGDIHFVHTALDYLGYGYQKCFDYPAALEKYFGRKIHTSTIDEVDGNPALWNVFIKPKGFTKRFTGRVVRGTKDLVGCGDQFSNIPVWVSEIVDFVAEWRVFVRYGDILDVRPYKGDWRATFDAAVIENAVTDFKHAPHGYALDFGVTKDGRTLLVEANDGYSIGAYGLHFNSYAKLLSARWAQLTAQKDMCYF